MRTIEEHINKETKTIKRFQDLTGNAVKIRKIMNEGFSRYDFTFRLKDKIYLTEVKTRNVGTNFYPTTILEKSKCDYISNLAKEYNESGISDYNIKFGFLVAFSDGGMYFFDYEKVNTFESTLRCQKTSIKNGNNDMVDKKMINFKTSDGIKIN